MRQDLVPKGQALADLGEAREQDEGGNVVCELDVAKINELDVVAGGPRSRA
jgi:hypothetical protein